MSSTTEVKGYVLTLSATRPCKNGVQFDFKFQDGEKSARNLRGFGSDSYRKIKDFYSSKRPVFIELYNSPGYETPVCNSRSKVRNVTYHEVPFRFDLSVQAKISTAQESMPESVRNILDSVDCDKYFTVKGRLHVGSGPVKSRPNGSKFKEDITIFDASGSASLTLWNGSWEQCESGNVFSITHVKFRSFRERVYLTASPFSSITKLEDPAMPPIPDNFSDGVTSIVEIDNFEIGLLTSFSACGVCQKKVLDGDIRAYSFLCVSCHRNHPLDRLHATYLLPLTFALEDSSTTLTISKEVGERDLQVNSADELVDALIQRSMEDRSVKLEYNTMNNHVESFIL